MLLGKLHLQVAIDEGLIRARDLFYQRSFDVVIILLLLAKSLADFVWRLDRDIVEGSTLKDFLSLVELVSLE
jgi:hypothetical protein